MTVNDSSMMASQVYNNNKIQSQSGASGMWTGAAQSSSSDFSAMAQQFMTTMDTNKSGSVDKAEFSQAAQALAKNANNSSNIDAVFGKMDTNSDGQITSDEMMAALKQATTQTQGKHHHGGHHHTEANTSDLTPQSTQTNTSTQASTMSDFQKSLFSKIMVAYGSSTSTTGTVTNLSV